MMKGTEQKSYRAFADSHEFGEIKDSQIGVFREDHQSLAVTTQKRPTFSSFGHARIMYIQ